ncbi:hypothetical protein F2Q68_00016938 [Brassica cretica]|uniref:Glycosyltransferase N-terminal domain-containing protein n=1 Tax=Brassica cretica TaxID=69181 RepID=A0A8S9HEG2_BRACR|nr:hypothetical protein F2Q68_00016938 [Brassica cretica]
MELSSSPLPPHVMLVSFPGQGHVNPLLRLGKLLASKGLLVTFVTTESWGKKMRTANKIQDRALKPIGKGYLRFDFFNDGLPEDDDASRTNLTILRPQLELVGQQEIKNLVKRYKEVMKQPVTCLINNPFVSWVCDVAEDLQIPCAVLWVQSCACLASYYYYNHKLVDFPTETDPKIDWGDQVTDAAYMIDVFKTGVRLSRGETEERVVPREEVAERLREVTKGEKATELKKNALKWKEEAEAAVARGGSSDRNLDEFVEKLGVKPVAKQNGSLNQNGSIQKLLLQKS